MDHQATHLVLFNDTSKWDVFGRGKMKDLYLAFRSGERGKHCSVFTTQDILKIQNYGFSELNILMSPGLNKTIYRNSRQMFLTGY